MSPWLFSDISFPFVNFLPMWMNNSPKKGLEFDMKNEWNWRRFQSSLIELSLDSNYDRTLFCPRVIEEKEAS